VTAWSTAVARCPAFVPGYDNGRGSLWRLGSHPRLRRPGLGVHRRSGHDVAFLAVAQPSSNTKVENVTGTERLAIGQLSTA